jgi:uncharacterized protein
MEVERVDDPVVFLERAKPFLLSAEARHNLILGIVGTLVSDPDAYPGFELLVVAESDRCVAASVRTPPYNVILSDAAEEEALDPLIHALLPSASEIPGVIGNRPTVEAFVDRWQRASGTAAKVQMLQGVFEARSVNRVPRAHGVARRASLDDRELVGNWLGDFEHEALSDSAVEEEESKRVRRKWLVAIESSTIDSPTQSTPAIGCS